jgi:hypothetical protein
MSPASRALGGVLDPDTEIAGQAERGGERGERPAGPGERITVALVPTAASGLRRLQERTSLSKTDIANRAITSYDFLDEHLQAGHELIVRDTKTGETQLVRFL